METEFLITISRAPNYTGERAALLNALRFLPGMGQTKAGRVADGLSVTVSITESILRRYTAVDGIVIMRDPAMHDAPWNATPDNTPAQEAAPMNAPVTPATDLGSLLATAVIPHVQAHVQRMVDDAVGARVPREIVIREAGKPDVKIDGHVHPVFDKVVRLAKAGVSVMLVGPAGCGKTHLFSQVCTALQIEHDSISLSGGVTEAHLTGRLLPTGAGGKFEYIESPFVRMYTSGGGFLLDEMDGGDPNVMLSVNQATANGGFSIEARAASGLPTRVERHPNTVLMATANTFGTGAGALYVGRNQLDAATLDRWYVVQMDYDKAFEERIAPSQVTHFVWRLRELITANKWRRVASTRMIQKAAAALGAGIDWKEVRGDILSGYTADELSKINL